MPQMAPISWLFLFIVFSMTFILFNMMNYFTFFYPAPSLKNSKLIKTNQMNWKW